MPQLFSNQPCVAALAVVWLFAAAAPARAAIVNWDVDSSLSYVRLTIPDQSVNVDGITATVRLRDAGNTAQWTDNGGRRQSLEGTLSTNLIDGNSISFTGGAHNLFALETGSFRPNPADFDPNATSEDSPDGTYSDTTGAPAAFAARARGTTLITFDLAFIAFRDVFFDAASAALALDGGGNFAGGTNNFGIASFVIDVDGLSAPLLGQAIPDIANEPLGSLMSSNNGGGQVISLGGLSRQLILNVNVPLQIDLEGTLLNATATGRIVAFATIPEPSTIALTGLAALGLCWAGRRRFRRS